MSHIFIEGLEVDTVIGVYEHEKKTKQTLTFDIEVGLRSYQAFTSDSLKDTIDYASVADLVRVELSDHSFSLLESLAYELCSKIAAQFGASRVRLKVSKGNIVPGARHVGVVLEREFPVH